MYTNRHGGPSIRLGSLGLAAGSYGLILAALISSIPPLFAYAPATILVTRNIPVIDHAPTVPLCRTIEPKSELRPGIKAKVSLPRLSTRRVSRPGSTHRAGRRAFGPAMPTEPLLDCSPTLVLG